MLREDVTIQIPSMGDSISEGSVAEIEKQPGAGTQAACNATAARLSAQDADLYCMPGNLVHAFPSPTAAPVQQQL